MAASALVLGIYVAGAAAAGALASRLAGRSTGVAVGSTLLAAVLFHPVRVRVQGVVDRLWRRDRALLPELLELLRALSGVEGPQAVAKSALGPLRRLADARGAALLTRRGARYEVVGRDGELDEEVSGGSLPAGGPLEQALLSRPVPQAVRDLEEDAARECASLMKMSPELLVPVIARGQLTGIVALTARTRGLYGYGVRRALAQVAPHLALALENAALVHDGVMRERLAALGQLAAVIVHEVKNPLGIIKVSAGQLKKRANDDASVELAACIEDEVDRMDATVRRLLELARPQAPSLRPTDVGAVIRQMLDRLRPDLDSAGIEIAAELPPAPPVSADPDELRGAFLNLFLNAREAMPQGGRLTVRLRPADPALADRRLEIDVEDTGCGMDEATQRNLFRPFFTTRHGGTGLGLALVKRVVEDHRGNIRVQSRPGEGARFTLSLPS
jgi:signal transduction histidine kinase